MVVEAHKNRSKVDEMREGDCMCKVVHIEMLRVSVSYLAAFAVFKRNAVPLRYDLIS